jgi:LPS sulfotransferase NodH
VEGPRSLLPGEQSASGDRAGADESRHPMRSPKKRAGAAQISRTWFVASTPFAGSRRLGQLLGQSNSIVTPRTWFDPLRVPHWSRTLSIPLGASDWAARYLEAVGEAATRHGLCAISLQWSHVRWLVQIARVALRTPTDHQASLDSEVLAAWFPEPKFVWVHAPDRAYQALRWYLALHPERGRGDRREGAGGSRPDYQEVRWLEAVIERQQRAWTTFFRLHGIVPHAIEYDAIVSQDPAALDAFWALLDLAPGDEGARPEMMIDDVTDQQAVSWLEPYRAIRPRLRAAVGVRSPLT